MEVIFIDVHGRKTKDQILSKDLVRYILYTKNLVIKLIYKIIVLELSLLINAT